MASRALFQAFHRADPTPKPTTTPINPKLAANIQKILRLLSRISTHDFKEVSAKHSALEFALFQRILLLELLKQMMGMMGSDALFRTNTLRMMTDSRCHDRHSMLEPEMLLKGCPLDNARQLDNQQAQGRPRLDGLLDVLPLEIFQNILLDRLDLASLTSLRCLSKTFRRAINDILQYNAIVAHAPSSLRALLSLEVASSYTCKCLYERLCFPKCHCCNAFGACLSTILCQRTCFRCFAEQMDCLTITNSFGKLTSNLSAREMDDLQIPVARTIPGIFHKSRYRFISK